MSNKTKIIFITIASMLIMLPVLTHAYTLLQPLPQGPAETSTSINQFSYYLSWWFKFGLVAAALLAVVQIVIAGVMLIIGGASETTIGKAWSKIQDALWGVVLAFGAWLLLSLISPQFVSMQLTIPPIVVDKSLLTTGGTSPLTTVNASEGFYAWANITKFPTCDKVEGGSAIFEKAIQISDSVCAGKIGTMPVGPSESDKYICCAAKRKGAQTGSYWIIDGQYVNTCQDYVDSNGITVEQGFAWKDYTLSTCSSIPTPPGLAEPKCCVKEAIAIGNIPGVTPEGTYIWENGDPAVRDPNSLDQSIKNMWTCERINAKYQTRDAGKCTASGLGPPPYKGMGAKVLSIPKNQDTSLCCLLPK